VIIDSSPLLAVTDAAILATNSDGVLLITRFGKTKHDQLAHAVGSLEDVGAPVLGAALTMLSDRRRAAYSYTYYGHEQAPSPALDAPSPTPAIEQPGGGKRRHQAVK
jgi:Mrp family chromosome partitioning ATPase